MMDEHVVTALRVKPGTRLKLKDRDPAWAELGKATRLGKAEARAEATADLEANLAALAAAQELFYASNTYAALVVIQAMDAAGKDGLIKHVMSGLNPQGCQVFAFKQPSDEELDHTFLWRCMKALPERGRIGIFNRSYYEEVLVVRVHPELLGYQRLPVLARHKPGADPGDTFWQDRHEDINAFERHLTRNGTVVLKFFLHVSKEEQRRRFLDRLTAPGKQWKFSAADLPERARWDDYMRAYEATLSATSTEWAPWYVIPADRKWMARALVAGILTSAIEGLDLRIPEPSSEERSALDEARRQLEAEGA
jgi:PPK2 family polyphosphate:nucleotide phosphotransferase